MRVVSSHDLQLKKIASMSKNCFVYKQAITNFDSHKVESCYVKVISKHNRDVGILKRLTCKYINSVKGCIRAKLCDDVGNRTNERKKLRLLEIFIQLEKGNVAYGRLCVRVKGHSARPGGPVDMGHKPCKKKSLEINKNKHKNKKKQTHHEKRYVLWFHQQSDT